MKLSGSVILLPPPLQRRLEATARDFIYPGYGSARDFAFPAGEPALTAPGSVSWQVFKNPLAVCIGGIAAVILELAEPRVRTGVWNHTSFRDNPLSRLQHTGFAAMMTVYGPRSRAEAMIAKVRRMHGLVHGTTPEGYPYRADDPELLRWVYATASFGFLESYNAYVRTMPDAQRNSFLAEGARSTLLYGAQGAPASQQELDLLFETMRGKLEPSPIVFEFLDIMRRVPIMPRPLAPVQGLLVRAAVGILPQWARERLGLSAHWDLRPWQRQLVKAGAAAADRVLLRTGPAVQSCRRLGLPDDYLYTPVALRKRT